MPSTFRLMSAEFKKIFKRPSVFIVALLLVATIVASTYLFNPNKIENNNISYSNVDTSQEFYNTFYDSDIADAQISIHKIFDKTDDNINYYNLNYERINKLEENYQIINKTFSDLEKEQNSELKETKRKEFKTALSDFRTHYTTFGSLANYPHILVTNDNEEYLTSCKAINELIDYCNDTSKSAQEVVNFYHTNNYSTKIKNELDFGINYISKTLDILINNTLSDYTQFKREVENNNAINVNKKKEARDKLLLSLTSLSVYFHQITNFEIPIAILTEENFKIYKNLFEDIIITLEQAESNQSISNALQYCENQSFPTLINDLNNKVTQVKITNEFTDTFKEINKKVIDNRKKIDDRITLFRNDGTLRNISFCATEYKLLATAYNSYVNDKIILSIAQNYDSNTFTKFYGYDFNEINIYEINENITKNEYYINNNKYANSFINSFSFNQNTTSNTNVYDFMYFTLEFCSLIIIFFAMMLLCNLITAETESGTIKLLLVRPFKRSKIISAKLMATIFFVIVFMLFSAILSFVVGYFSFGYINANILAVFNGSIAFEINPLLLMGINVLSLILDVVFYVIIALMLSIIFKNFAGSLTSCLVIFITFIVLNAVFPTAFWYSFFPTMNLHLFKYLGNAFITIDTENMLFKSLITPIQSTMSIAFSLLLTISYMIIMLIISYTIFKKRDF